MEALAALKASRPNSAVNVREVQEDFHSIIDSGHFSSCMPVAVDTRDGIRLVFQFCLWSKSAATKSRIVTTSTSRVDNHDHLSYVEMKEEKKVAKGKEDMLQNIVVYIILAYWPTICLRFLKISQFFNSEQGVPTMT